MTAPQPVTVGGRQGSVVYLNDDWDVVPAEKATLARVIFEDGGSAFYHVSNVKAAGDVEGHEFHGNQWTGGSGVDPAAKEKEILESEDHQNWADSLLGDEKEVIEMYAGPDGRSEWINRSLRTSDDFNRSTEMKNEIANLDSALARSKNTTEQTVYRGISSPSLIDRLKPGVEFVDRGFVSASLNPEHAQIFGDVGGKINVLQMKTSIGAYISDITGPTTIQDVSVNEHEWLLPRNQRFRVEKVEEHGKLRVFHVGVVGR